MSSVARFLRGNTTAKGLEIFSENRTARPCCTSSTNYLCWRKRKNPTEVPMNNNKCKQHGRCASAAASRGNSQPGTTDIKKHNRHIPLCPLLKSILEVWALHHARRACRSDGRYRTDRTEHSPELQPLGMSNGKEYSFLTVRGGRSTDTAIDVYICRRGP